MPRGGRRAGKPGVAYPNRNDLSTAPRPLPAVAVTGQGYGQATAQQAAMRAVPMASGPLSSVPAPPQAGPAPAPGGPVGAFDRPTERPTEPITAGMPTGPGPGPEALNLPQMQAQNLGEFINQLAAGPGASSAVQYLAQYVNGGRQ